MIIENRGKREGVEPEIEKRLTNNIILKKLKIALDMKAEDVIRALEIANFRLGKSELSAFFRKPKHKHYRVCKDQILRNFIHGLQIQYRPDTVSGSEIGKTGGGQAADKKGSVWR